jgi:tRNA U34 5-methylaminomethyl-2-thiouridine-forming methyltransferase MnmC
MLRGLKFVTEDGSHSIMSEQFGVAYHSTHGAIQETQHVFIDAGLKHVLLQNLAEISILDIGFGTGLNAFMTYLEAERLGLKIRYIAYEKYPLSIEEAKRSISALNSILRMRPCNSCIRAVGKSLIH